MTKEQVKKILEQNDIIVKKQYGQNFLLDDNILKNIGMRQEAILRNRKINNKTGKPENLIIFSITKEEMQKQKVS